MLVERRDSVATAAERAGNRPDTDESVSRRDDISLQGMTTITAAVRDVEEEEDVTMRAVLLQLIDTAVFIFNLAFLTVTEAAAASQRHLITRKHQNKLFIVFQE
ncbi:hypothetical protein BDBG_06995 [Blastomyces gilchristii SLH14081]|uniref:Uncharacterized protein n=1 Tax=Blastomyces gilchristii (strain SLH14081) TaxID=559298 RepID=A0A179UUM9_BLAGS|nr:uncharacterized protein BDBG_06995 [Blastomyces gilchristii SLH14081]OAT11530.1 hypothetical protein BDBG_06995 [Blastomyces gilchristii SLH14081]